MQRSQTPPDPHPRHHLDLHVTSPAEQEAEAERLDGNRFCIVDLSHGE